jgi:hypothetical protein
MIDAVLRYEGYVVQSTGDGIFMSITTEDVQASQRARLLLSELGGRMQGEGRS